MGLSAFSRRILGPSSFPQLESQELPDPVPLGPKEAEPDPSKRDDALGFKRKPKQKTPNSSNPTPNPK